ncbi:SbcC/MukB-like Walker B domain-containing protein [Labrys monachus]|uniref:Energy-coupling factor transporter ATP-binding protein EcfA2 n=1 Tax=Labrys monachus TaxID=217067 RepID=A0ABU0FFG2_9HYPH|nr:SbcC/MukB-like Walker B domain-containing protein [Labrys monachus]MDQ0392879.1 energy-coupling factor transporter ATP-binding protein EcfA2 [Labrys monachus]
MMHLRRISLVSWHLFARADLDLAGNGAILGKNATGKSTLIDLVQAVMTGGSGNLYRFNRSAGEGGGRSERTLRGYCLGQTDQHVTLREQGITHVALVFEDTAGLRPPVTLGLCLEARRNEEVRTSGRYVAEGVAIDSRHFVEAEGSEERPAPWALVRARLDLACRQAGGQLHQHPAAARTYIREYMRLLFTGRRSPDPDRFIKAFVMALSFEDMRSVEDFVRSYLLERNDIDIAELRESIQRYRQIQKDIHELERKLAALKLIRGEIERFDRLVAQEELGLRMQRLAVLLESGKALFANLEGKRRKKRALDTIEAEIERIDAEIESTAREEESLRAQIEATGVEGKRYGLKQEIALVERDRTDLLRRLKERHLGTARAVELLRHRERLKGLGLGEIFTALEAIEASSEGLAPPAWPRDPGAMEKRIAVAAAVAAERLPRLEDRRDEAIGYRRQCEHRIAEIRTRIAESRQGRVLLQPNTLALMEALRSRGFRPRALCQVLEVLDESWRNAAEALLGRDRETILVDPGHAEDAVSLLRRERDRFKGCRVANSRKLAGLAKAAQAGSLASILRSDDELAMALVVQRLGSIRLAETQEELFLPGRAIMRDGTYDDGIVIEVRHPDGLKIGRVAAELMLDRLQAELTDEQQLAQTHRGHADFLTDICGRLHLLTIAPAETETLETLASALAEIDDRRADLQERIDRVGLLLDPAIQESFSKVRRRLKVLHEERGERQTDRGGLRAELTALDIRLNAGEGEIGSWWSLRTRRRLFRDRLPDLASFIAVRPAYAKRSAGRSHGRAAQEIQDETRRLAQERQDCVADIRGKVIEYCVTFAAQRPFDRESDISAVVKIWAGETIGALEDNELIRYRQQADQAAERVIHLFRSSFIHELNSRFRNLETEMEDLRAALRSKQLHGEVYSLHALVKPEFRSLHDLARASENDERILLPLFGAAAAADHPYKQALGEVEKLLQDEELNFEVYQDYRNYYSFDLRMRNASGHETSYDRRRGVASGAERQVPFYVIIGAALASIYHGTRKAGDESARGMGLAVFDEAFSKLDGQNQRTILHFYNDVGLQVLIAAPTEKRAVVYENLDTVIDVFRFGDEAEAEVSHIKELARQAIRRANPQHLSDEDLRAQLAASAADAFSK